MTNIICSFSAASRSLSRRMHELGALTNMAVDLSSVRVMAMKSAAGTPLPETSAITKPRCSSSIMK